MKNKKIGTVITFVPEMVENSIIYSFPATFSIIFKTKLAFRGPLLWSPLAASQFGVCKCLGTSGFIWTISTVFMDGFQLFGTVVVHEKMQF